MTYHMKVGDHKEISHWHLHRNENDLFGIYLEFRLLCITKYVDECFFFFFKENYIELNLYFNVSYYLSTYNLQRIARTFILIKFDMYFYKFNDKRIIHYKYT